MNSYTFHHKTHPIPTPKIHPCSVAYTLAGSEMVPLRDRIWESPIGAARRKWEADRMEEYGARTHGGMG